MAKHGIVTISAAGVPTFEERNGLSGLTAGIGTLFSYQKAPVGLPSVYSRVATLVAGNMIAVQSMTGKIGVAALGRTYTM